MSNQNQPAAKTAPSDAMAAHGAGLIDVGGESTRPGAAAVDQTEESQRTFGVIKVLVGEGKDVEVHTPVATMCEYEEDLETLSSGQAEVNNPDPGDPTIPSLEIHSSFQIYEVKTSPVWYGTNTSFSSACHLQDRN